MSGTLLLALVSGVAAMDYLIAFWFIARANRAQSEVGAAPRLDSDGEANNPEALRRIARLLMLTAPVAWLIVAALSFGILPVDGIVPIKF